MTKTDFRVLLLKQKFSPTAKVNKLLEKTGTSDYDLAKAILTTKAYKENAEVRNAADIIITRKMNEDAEQPVIKKSNSRRAGEP